LAALNSPFCFNILEEGMIDVAPAEELDVKLNDMVFANKKTFDKKYDAIRKCIELIFQAGEELEANPQSKLDALKQWYTVNGSEVEEATLNWKLRKNYFQLKI